MSHLLSIKIRVIQSNLVNLKSPGTRDLFDTSLQIRIHIWSRGQISNFEFCCTPQEEKVGYYFQSGTCLGASETHVLLSFLWSAFCKWPVITVTPKTLKISVHKIKD